MTVFKLLLKIVVAPVIVLLTLFVWTCVALVYVSGLVLGLASMARDVSERGFTRSASVLRRTS